MIKIALRKTVLLILAIYLVAIGLGMLFLPHDEAHSRHSYNVQTPAISQVYVPNTVTVIDPSLIPVDPPPPVVEVVVEPPQTTQAPNYVRDNQPVYSQSNNGDFLECVKKRESGGDYTIHNSGGSGASGAYQFMQGTWNSVANSIGRGDLVGIDPASASPADQDTMARALYQMQGASPWGGSCS